MNKLAKLRRCVEFAGFKLDSNMLDVQVLEMITHLIKLRTLSNPGMIMLMTKDDEIYFSKENGKI